ncbi:hypothetical protein SNEBB_005390 [Seison nebaliae]|nr:hypothetical protein SNEBB_005390 [Seison nebaliae]
MSKVNLFHKNGAVAIVHSEDLGLVLTLENKDELKLLIGMKSPLRLMNEENKNFDFLIRWTNIFAIESPSSHLVQLNCFIKIKHTKKQFDSLSKELEFVDREKFDVTLYFPSKEIVGAFIDSIQTMIRSPFINENCSSGKKCFVAINPFSGKKLAGKIWENSVRPIMDKCKLKYKELFTKNAQTIYKFFEGISLSDFLEEYYLIIIISGDGLIHDLINVQPIKEAITQSIDNYEDQMNSIKNLSILHITGGSGNALATSILYRSRDNIYNSIEKTALYGALSIVKGTPISKNVMQIKYLMENGASGDDNDLNNILYSVVNIEWGYFSDVDLESEKLRFLGGKRFDIYAMLRLISFRRYAAELHYMPHNDLERVERIKRDDFVFVFATLITHAAPHLMLLKDMTFDEPFILLLWATQEKLNRKYLFKKFMSIRHGFDLAELEESKFDFAFVRKFDLIPTPIPGGRTSEIVVDGERTGRIGGISVQLINGALSLLTA